MSKFTATLGAKTTLPDGKFNFSNTRTLTGRSRKFVGKRLWDNGRSVFLDILAETGVGNRNINVNLENNPVTQRAELVVTLTNPARPNESVELHRSYITDHLPNPTVTPAPVAVDTSATTPGNVETESTATSESVTEGEMVATTA